MQTSHLNTSGVGAETMNPARSDTTWGGLKTHASPMIVGGNRSGERIKWFGNRVLIDGAPHVLHRAYFTSGTHRRYYVLEGMDLQTYLHCDTVDWIEVIA